MAAVGGSMFATPMDWISHCHKIVRNDLDNLVLFAGDPGLGKSTLMMQIGLALDPNFSRDRIHFTVKDFLEDAKQLPPFSCVAADELLMNRRRSMTKDNMDVMDFLQVCRAMNLHILLCFPHAAMLDRGVLDRRVRYRIDIPKRGEAYLSERIFRTIRDFNGQEDYAVNWIPRSPPWRFGPNSGPRWEDYLAKKLTAARQRVAEARGFKGIEEMDDVDAPRKGNTKTVDKQPRKRLKGRGTPKFLFKEKREAAKAAEEEKRKSDLQGLIPDS